MTIFFIVVTLSVKAQEEEYCCERNFIFPEFPMPAEQERDVSGFISGAWNSYIMKAGAHENEACPIKISLLSYSGTIDLEQMIEKISAVSQNKAPQQASDDENVKRNADYVWKGQLELTYIERIVPGKTEEAYGGGTEYEPGYVVGGWKFTVRLYDIQHEEVVKEASTTWTGSDIAFYKNLRNEYSEGKSDKLYVDVLEELYDREFSDLKQIILDYEKTPQKAQFESDVIKVNSDKTKRITFSVIDSKGEKPKKWQRLAVRVDYGSLTNGTRCCDLSEGPKFYSFMCESGEVILEYKSPPEEKSSLDHITVYNGCITKDPTIIPMTNVDIREELGSVDVDINPVYETRLIIKGRYIRNSNSRYYREDNTGVERGRSNLDELQEATFYVPLELERSDDMPILNQTWEFYRPKSINLTSCNVYSRRRTYDYANHKTSGFEQTGLLFKEPLGLQIFEKDIALQSNILVIIDKETGKVVKAMPGGFAVDFTWHERYQLTGRSWSKETGEKPINHSENRTDEYRSQYGPEPVEDPIPDPTFKSVSQSLRTYLKNLGTPLPADIEIPEEEEHPEITPDLLVKFGDGRTFFGGDGKVVLEDKSGPDFRIYSEKTFYWQITRRKK